MTTIYYQYSKIVVYRAGREKALFEKLASDIARREKLSKAIKSAKTDKKRKNTIRFYFKSFPVCKLALIQAAQKRSTLYTPEEIDALALKISQSQNVSEPIHIKLEEKPSGGIRLLSRSGIKRKALQIITRDLLKILGIGHEQDSIQNGGRDGAIKRLTISIDKNNCPYVVTSDIKDFYGSIEHSEVRKLLYLFPQDVIEFCVLNHPRHKLIFSSHSYYDDQDDAHLKRMVQQGLPQGSACSARIASALFGNLIEGLASPDRMVWQSDDLAICASNYSEAAVIKDALIDRCNKHPAGPFRLKFIKINKVDHSFSFLGYRVKYSYQKPYGKFAMAYPPKQAFQNLFERLTEFLPDLPSEDIKSETLEAMHCWLAGYSSWKIPHFFNDNAPEWIIPLPGLQNLIIQIENLMSEEYQKRGDKTAQGNLTDEEMCLVLKRYGHHRSGLYKAA